MVVTKAVKRVMSKLELGANFMVENHGQSLVSVQIIKLLYRPGFFILTE